SGDERLACCVTGPRRFPPRDHAKDFEIFLQRAELSHWLAIGNWRGSVDWAFCKELQAKASTMAGPSVNPAGEDSPRSGIVHPPTVVNSTASDRNGVGNSPTANQQNWWKRWTAYWSRWIASSRGWCRPRPRWFD